MPDDVRAAADRAEAAAAEMFGWQRPVGADAEPKQENGAGIGATGFAIGDAPPETDDEAIARLAKLPLPEYERRREPEAEKRGWRVSILDKLVNSERGTDAEPGQGRVLRIARPEPWPEVVDGAELLNDISAFLTQHVFLPAGAADALAAWAVHTYCFARFRHSPRVALTSPEPRCGKTTALDALNLLVCAPLPTANVTAAALFRTIEPASPTLLIDEADTFLRDNEDLRGALNAGHKQGGQVIRCVGDDAEPRTFSVFAPAAIAAIGKLGRLGTIEDRSLVVRMKRATRAERPAPLDRKAEAEGAELARKCARWTADHAAKFAEAEPALPPALFNRAADNWRCLFAIAELAGGGWPARLAAASAALAPDDDDEGRGIRLLGDVRAVFDARAANRMPYAENIGSADLCAALLAIEAAPWPEVNRGKPLTQNKLAALLRPYQITPGTVRLGGGPKDTAKGYCRDDFADPWRRYLPDAPAKGGEEPSHRHNPQKTAKNGAQHPSQAADDVTDRGSQKPRNSAACDGVTVHTLLPRLEGAGEVGESERRDLAAAERGAAAVASGPADDVERAEAVATRALADQPVSLPPERHREHVQALARAGLLRPPSWGDPTVLPSPGARCSCCRTGRWWCERENPSGWRCWKCHPPDGLPVDQVREVRT